MVTSEKAGGVGSGASWLDQEGAQGRGQWGELGAMFGMLGTWSCPSHGYPDVHMYSNSYWNVKGH